MAETYNPMTAADWRNVDECIKLSSMGDRKTIWMYDIQQWLNGRGTPQPRAFDAVCAALGAKGIKCLISD